MGPHEVDPGSSFERLLAHEALLRALARRIVGGHGDDVVQETWIAALTRRSVDPENELGWLARVTRNRALQWLRGARRREARESLVDAPRPADRADVADVLAREEERRRLIQAVIALDEPYRTTLLLHDLEGQSLRAVASRMRVPVDTVKTRRKRGLSKLRAALLRDFGGDRQALALAFAPLARLDVAASGAVATGLGAGGIAVKWVWSTAALVMLAVGAWFVVDPSDASSERPAAPFAPRPRAGADRAPTAAIAEDVASPPSERTAAATNAAPAASVLRGRVLTLADAPIPGASVYVVDAADPGGVDLAVDPNRSGVEVVTTDAHGAFSCPVSTAMRSARIAVVAPGMAPTVREIAIADPLDHAVRLAPSGALSGRVHDEFGQGIAGAIVRFSAWLGPFAVQCASTTSEAGTFVLEGIPVAGSSVAFSASSNAWLDVSANGFAPAVVPVAHAPAAGDGSGSSLDVELTRGRALEVIVVDAVSNARVADARVVAWSIEGPAEHPFAREGLGPDRDRIWADVQTDANGTCALSAVPRHPKRPATTSLADEGGAIIGYVAAVRPDGAIACAPLHATDADARSSVTLAVVHRSTVHGRVVDSGRHAVDAHVALEGDVVDVPWPYALRDAVGDIASAANGSFTLSCVLREPAPSRVTLTVSGAEGFARADVELRPGAAVDVGELVLGSAASAILEVLDESGAPVSGAAFESVPPGFTWPRSGTDGRSVLAFASDDAPVAACAALVFAPGYGVVKSPPLAPSTRPSIVRVTVAPEAVLRGRVDEADGSPAAGCFVRVEASIAPRDPLTPRTRRPEETLDGPLVGLGAAVCDVAGQFELRGLPAGPYRVYAVAVSSSIPKAPSRVTEVDGVMAGPEPCVLRLPPRQEALGFGAIRVVDARTGVPRADAELRIESVDPSVVRGIERLDASSWRLDVAPASPTRVRVVVPGFGFVDRELAVATGDNGEWTLRVGEGATLRGFVRGSGAPLRDGAELYFVDEREGRGPRAELGPDGSFVVRGVAAGTYRPQVWSPDRGDGATDIVVAADDPPWVVEVGATELVRDVDVSAGGEVRIVVRPHIGPLPGRPSFTIEDERQRIVRRTHALGAGDATRYGIAPGAYVLVVAIDDVVRERTPFTVRAHESTRVSVTLPE